MLTAIEIISVFFTLLYILFAIKQRPIAWIFGIFGALLSVYFFYKNSYYGSATLNIIYTLQGLLGYFQWRFYLKRKIPGFSLSFIKHIGLIIIVIAVFISVITFFREQYLHTMLRIDILLAIGSILATFLEIRKETSCWYYWIILNIGYAILYAHQHMYLYATLMLILGIFSIIALKEWKKEQLSND